MSVKVDQFLGRIKFAEEANETKIELGDLSSQSRYFYSIRRGRCSFHVTKQYT